MSRRISGGGGLRSLLFSLCLILFFTQSFAASPAHHGLHLAHRQVERSLSSSNSTRDQDELILQAFEVLRRRNKARVMRPVMNTYELADSDELAANATLAAPLELDADTTGHSTPRGRAKRSTQDDEEEAEDSSSPYSISPELAAAAARMAEANPQVPKGNHEDLARTTIEKYRHRWVNDTNVPPLKQRPYGRLGRYGVGEGFSQLHADSMSSEFRAMSTSSETWWMAQQDQLGSAPFAPASDYKVRGILVSFWPPDFSPQVEPGEPATDTEKHYRSGATSRTMAPWATA